MSRRLAAVLAPAQALGVGLDEKIAAEAILVQLELCGWRFAKPERVPSVGIRRLTA